jgi:hypothetical protein
MSPKSLTRNHRSVGRHSLFFQLNGWNQDTMFLSQKAVAVMMSCLLILTTIPSAAVGQTAASAGTPEEFTPLTPEDLDGLVAPIALYPDALVAQILGAATFPYEIVDAVVWLKQNSTLTGESLMKAVDQQSWDPAVKALTQFSSVLDNLAKNLAWTSALGEASATQQQDVMAAIQRMRTKAQAAGNLKSTPQIKVVQESPQTIVIQPANPQIVYVPVYSPTVVYGVPVVTPGYSSADVATAAIISFGVGIAVGAMLNGGYYGWGWGAWGTSWHSHTVIYRRNVYVGNSYWRGGYYGGSRPGYPGYRPGYPGYGGRPPNYPSGARPPYQNRPPATTLPARGGASTLPATRPATPANRPNLNPSTRPAATTPSTRPSTNELRGYQRPQTPNAGATPASRPNAFSGSGGGREQSVRGNQSLGGGKAKGGASRR